MVRSCINTDGVILTPQFLLCVNAALCYVFSRAVDKLWAEIHVRHETQHESKQAQIVYNSVKHPLYLERESVLGLFYVPTLKLEND